MRITRTQRFSLPLLCAVTVLLSSLSSAQAVDSVIGDSCSTLNATKTSPTQIQICAKDSTGLVWVKVPVDPSAPHSPDGFPPNILAPNRTCVTPGQTGYLGRIPLTCQQETNQSVWRIDLTKPVPNVSSNDPSQIVPIGMPTIRKGKPAAPLVNGMTDINLINAPIDFVSSVALNARKQFLLEMKNAPAGNPNIDWIIDNGVDPKKLAQLKSDITASARYWSALRPMSEPLRIYVSMSIDFPWLAQKANSDLSDQALFGGWVEYKLQRAQAEGAGYYGGASPGYSKDGTAVLLYFFGNQSYGDLFAAGASAHEYAHVAQRYALGNMAPMQCWVREGSAVYTGLNFGTHNSTASFRNGLLQTLNNLSGDPEIDGFANWPLEKYVQYFMNQNTKSVQNCDPIGNYIFGAMAWQYMYGTYGYQKVNVFFLNLKNSYDNSCNGSQTAGNYPCDSWKDSYSKAFGTTPELDYPKIANFVYSEIAWAKKQHVLQGDSALAIAPPAFLSKF